MNHRNPKLQEPKIDDESPFYGEIDTERALIGSMFHELPGSDPDAGKYERLKQQALRELTALDFFLPEHGMVWREMQSIFHEGKPFGDLVLIGTRMRDSGTLAPAGGGVFLADLFRAHFTCRCIPIYTARLKSKHSLRKMHTAAEIIVAKAEQNIVPDDAAPRLADFGITRFEAAKLYAAGLEADLTAEEATKRMLDQATSDVSRFYHTGFAELDQKTGGVGAGEMVIVAARPSMGKSMLVRQMALNMAANGISIGYISIEESPEKVMRNLAANLSGIENERMRRGQKGMTPAEFQRLTDASFHLSALPLRIADKSRDLDTVLSQIDRWKTQHGIEVLIIDYLQRISTDDKTEYERVSRCSREIADSIKTNQLAGVIVAQINRGVEQRESKIPGMSDLRSSGQIEQDADGIIFLHREDYYHETDNQYAQNHKADLIVSKWRDGERNYRVQLDCFVNIQRFCDRELEMP